jgi:hypothetical protein
MGLENAARRLVVRITVAAGAISFLSAHPQEDDRYVPQHIAALMTRTQQAVHRVIVPQSIEEDEGEEIEIDGQEEESPYSEIQTDAFVFRLPEGNLIGEPIRFLGKETAEEGTITFYSEDDGIFASIGSGESLRAYKLELNTPYARYIPWQLMKMRHMSLNSDGPEQIFSMENPVGTATLPPSSVAAFLAHFAKESDGDIAINEDALEWDVTPNEEHIFIKALRKWERTQAKKNTRVVRPMAGVPVPLEKQEASQEKGPPMIIFRRLILTCKTSSSRNTGSSFLSYTMPGQVGYPLEMTMGNIEAARESRKPVDLTALDAILKERRESLEQLPQMEQPVDPHALEKQAGAA